jgi:hypothetical protein
MVTCVANFASLQQWYRSRKIAYLVRSAPSLQATLRPPMHCTGKLFGLYDKCLLEDCRVQCEFVVFKDSALIPVSLQRIIQDAVQIFHIDRCKPSDLDHY